MTAPAAPITTAAATTGEFHGTSETAVGNGYSAPNGFQGYGYPVAPIAPTPTPVAPATAPRSRTGLPWFIAGATLWAIAFTQLMLLPQWLATKTTDGVVGNITGVLAEIGIGAALLAVGFTRRKQNP